MADLLALQEQGLHVQVERTDVPADDERVRYELELVGADRPGIVAEISALLAARRVSIEDLVTDSSTPRWPAGACSRPGRCSSRQSRRAPRACVRPSRRSPTG